MFEKEIIMIIISKQVSNILKYNETLKLKSHAKPCNLCVLNLVTKLQRWLWRLAQILQPLSYPLGKGSMNALEMVWILSLTCNLHVPCYYKETSQIKWFPVASLHWLTFMKKRDTLSFDLVVLEQVGDLYIN